MADPDASSAGGKVLHSPVGPVPTSPGTIGVEAINRFFGHIKESGHLIHFEKCSIGKLIHRQERPLIIRSYSMVISACSL